MKKPVKPEKRYFIFTYPYFEGGELRLGDGGKRIGAEALTYSLVCNIAKLVPAEVKDFEIEADSYYTDGDLIIRYEETNSNYKKDLEEYKELTAKYKEYLLEKKSKNKIAKKERAQKNLQSKIQKLENEIKSLKEQL